MAAYLFSIFIQYANAAMKKSEFMIETNEDLISYYPM